MFENQRRTQNSKYSRKISITTYSSNVPPIYCENEGFNISTCRLIYRGIELGVEFTI